MPITPKEYEPLAVSVIRDNLKAVSDPFLLDVELPDSSVSGSNWTEEVMLASISLVFLYDQFENSNSQGDPSAPNSVAAEIVCPGDDGKPKLPYDDIKELVCSTESVELDPGK